MDTDDKATLDLDAITARATAATPGPWEITDRNGDHVRRKIRGADDRMVLGMSALLWPDPADEAFLTHAREDVPALLAALAAERGRADRAEAALEDVWDEGAHFGWHSHGVQYFDNPYRSEATA